MSEMPVVLTQNLLGGSVIARISVRSSSARGHTPRTNRARYGLAVPRWEINSSRFASLASNSIFVIVPRNSS